MKNMFYGAASFNGDLGAWQTAAVMDMSWMFYQATSFNGDLGAWTVSAVTEEGGRGGMTNMFKSSAMATDLRAEAGGPWDTGLIAARSASWDTGMYQYSCQARLAAPTTWLPSDRSLPGGSSTVCEGGEPQQLRGRSGK